MKKIHLVHLYAKEMNIYGDTGNRLVFQRRLEWRGYGVKISLIGIGDKVPTDSDIILGGGGQDKGQMIIEADLQAKADDLKNMADDGVVMLMICGLYQQFGTRFITSNGQEIKGISILPLETRAGSERMIGNTIIKTKWGELVAYENHSGLTTLADTSQTLGTVKKGAGNNGTDGTEGCVYQNVFGSYSHGPLLSKNPAFADELLSRALVRKYGSLELETLDDSLELKAAGVVKTRPR